MSKASFLSRLVRFNTLRSNFVLLTHQAEVVPYEQIHTVALFKLLAVTCAFIGNKKEPHGGWRAGTGVGENMKTPEMRRYGKSLTMSWVESGDVPELQKEFIKKSYFYLQSSWCSAAYGNEPMHASKQWNSFLESCV